MELDRFAMFCLMTVLTSLVAQSVGLVIGACCGIQVRALLTTKPLGGPVTFLPARCGLGEFIVLSYLP